MKQNQRPLNYPQPIQQSPKTPESPYIIRETLGIAQQSSPPQEPTAMDIDGLTIPTMSSVVFTSNQAA
jgi:hypothetical protein